MPEDMSISVNGHTQVPPGFRFHPTEEELLHYYLKKKVSYEKIDLDVIRDVDLNKLEPWDIQEKCKIGSTPQNDWYFFSHKDKKYPTGTRTNRATAAGFWKATGRDKTILGQGKRIGMRKTLVFYKGRAPHGQKSDWIMHEYRLDENISDAHVCNVLGDQTTQEEGWVVCRIFKKKSHHNKTLESHRPPPISSSSIVRELDSTGTQILDEESCPYDNEGAGLGQILEYTGRSTCKEEAEANNVNINSTRFINYPRPNIDTSRFMRLPSLESPNPTRTQSCYQPTTLVTENESSPIPNTNNQVSCTNNNVDNLIPDQAYNHHHPLESSLTNWSALDRLVASHLNGHTETYSRQFVANFFGNDLISNIGNYCNPDYHHHQHPDPYSNNNIPGLRTSNSLPSNFTNSKVSSDNYHGGGGGAHQEYYNQLANNEIDHIWAENLNFNANTPTRSSSSSVPLCHVSNYRIT